MYPLGCVQRCRMYADVWACAAPCHAQVLTDDTRVRQIVMNGLTNAVKYSNAPANGPIRIAVHTCANEAQPQAFPTHARTPAPGTMEPRWLIFDVLDCGPGLRGVTESVLFADFTAPIGVHMASEGSFRIGSSGVGLPVCARCVMLQ